MERSLATIFSRCQGCEVVREGETCLGLLAAVVHLGVLEPGFESDEIYCKKLDPYKESLENRIKITPKGAVYGLGKAFEAAANDFFGLS